MKINSKNMADLVSISWSLLYQLLWPIFPASKTPKNKHMNPRIGHHDSGHKNKIDYCSYVRNQTINMNMLMFWRKSARIEDHDSMFRGQFARTYIAIQGVLRSGFDRFCFTGYQARELRSSFRLKMPPISFLIPHFFKDFLQFILAVIAVLRSWIRFVWLAYV